MHKPVQFTWTDSPTPRCITTTGSASVSSPTSTGTPQLKTLGDTSGRVRRRWRIPFLKTVLWFFFFYSSFSKRSPTDVPERRGVRSLYVRQCHLRPVSKLQLPPRLPPDHRVQDSFWLLPQDLQQSRVCFATQPVRPTRLWGCLWTHQNVHY